MVCNDFRTGVKEDGRWVVQGDPTEGALTRVRSPKPVCTESDLPASCRRSTTHAVRVAYGNTWPLFTPWDGQPLDAVRQGWRWKFILSKCDSDVRPIRRVDSLFDAQELLTEAETMAAKGLRVLAFAMKTVGKDVSTIDHASVASGMVFLGFQAMIDPPRKEAIEAVKSCHKAGIQIKMITGDHALTASAIAKKLGWKSSAADHESGPVCDNRPGAGRFQHRGGHRQSQGYTGFCPRGAGAEVAPRGCPAGVGSRGCHDRGRGERRAPP